MQESLFPDIPVHTSWIYAGIATNHLVKWGFTERVPVSRRGGELGIETVMWVPGDRTTERRIQAYYAAERIGDSEWFHPSTRLLLDIYPQVVRQHGRRSRRARRVRTEIDWAIEELKRPLIRADYPEAA